MKKSTELDDLLEEALDNAQQDRDLAMDAYEKMKSIFDVDSGDPNTMQSVMLIGQSAVKLLEQLSRSNEQIIKLTQLRQKDRPAAKDREPLDLEKIKAVYKQYE